MASGRGDEVAFAALYDQVAPTVCGVVGRVVRDRAQSEEVVQEVFLEVWRLAPRYEPARGSARGWVATIAHRRAVDRVRSEQAARDREAREHRLAPAGGHSEDHLVDHVEHERVRRALAKLSENQRQVVELAYFGGHSYRHVATLLQMPEGTVKTRIRDGLIRLRAELGVSS